MIRPFKGLFVRKGRAKQSYPRTAEVCLVCVKARRAPSSTRAGTYHRYLSLCAIARKEGKQKPGHSLTPTAVQQWPLIDERESQGLPEKGARSSPFPHGPGSPSTGAHRNLLCVSAIGANTPQRKVKRPSSRCLRQPRTYAHTHIHARTVFLLVSSPRIKSSLH